MTNSSSGKIMSDVLSPERIAEIGRMLMKMDSVLRRFEYVTMGGASINIVERGENWFSEAEARGIQISKFDDLLYGGRTIGGAILIQQAHDAYILGLLDAATVLCRTALEEELTIRYLDANGLTATVAAGTRFKTLVDDTTPASLESLINWATTTSPPILTTTTLPMAKDVQEVGNDYAHAYAMRRVSRPMAGTGNWFTNTRALEIYEKALKVLGQMT